MPSPSRATGSAPLRAGLSLGLAVSLLLAAASSHARQPGSTDAPIAPFDAIQGAVNDTVNGVTACPGRRSGTYYYQTHIYVGDPEQIEVLHQHAAAGPVAKGG